MFCVFVMYCADNVAIIEATIPKFVIWIFKNGGRQLTEKPFTSK